MSISRQNHGEKYRKREIGAVKFTLKQKKIEEHKICYVSNEK